MPGKMRRAVGSPSPSGADSVARSALQRFMVAGLVALLVVSIATVVVARSTARDIALRQAKAQGFRLAAAMHPSLQVRELQHPHSAAAAKLKSQIDPRRDDKSLLHVKILNSAGGVVWSDPANEPGDTTPLKPRVADILGKKKVVAVMSDSADGEGEEFNGDPVLEVHVGAKSVDGDPLVIESWWSAGMLQRNTAAIMRRIAPLPLGALLIFALLVFPLARRLARRVEQAQAERSRLLQHALSASDLERRRIARDLHDGVMQELSGAGYALSAALAALPPEGAQSRRMMEQVNAVIRDAGASLRSMLTDIYPTSLERNGLEAAVDELAERTADAGIAVSTNITGLSDVSLEATQLSYRVIREGLHNVRRHSGARHTDVTASRKGSQVVISVADDGRGPTTPDNEEGHLGLRLLTDTLQDLGGTLTLAARPGGGAVLTATFPLSLAGQSADPGEQPVNVPVNSRELVRGRLPQG
jgi:signal transduction histidine kinase